MIVVAVAVGVSKIELIVLLISIAFVLVAEMINTAIEGAIDAATTSFDPMAKLAKDIAAGAVLIASVNAVAVGYLVFAGKAADKTARGPRPGSECAGRDHAGRARADGDHRHRHEGLDGSRDAAPRRPSVRTCRRRLRGLDGRHLYRQRLAPLRRQSR